MRCSLRPTKRRRGNGSTPRLRARMAPLSENRSGSHEGDCFRRGETDRSTFSDASRFSTPSARLIPRPTQNRYRAGGTIATWRCSVLPRFDRPPLNIFGPETIPQLNEIITALEVDEQVKVVVFDSAVDGLFLTRKRGARRLTSRRSTCSRLRGSIGIARQSDRGSCRSACRWLLREGKRAASNVRRQQQ